MLAQWGQDLPIHPMIKRHFFPLRSMMASATALRTSALGWGMSSSNDAADCMSGSARERWMTSSNSWNMFPLAHCWQSCQLMVVFPEPATPSRRILTGFVVLLYRLKWCQWEQLPLLDPHFDCSLALVWALVGQIWCCQAVAIRASVMEVGRKVCSSLRGTAWMWP